MTGKDRFYLLPDELLAHILSYLPTKEAVRAQLISKRWKNMWAYVPVLDFDFADFWSEDLFNHPDYPTWVNEDSQCHENFVRVIDDVLTSRRIQQINMFKLVWHHQVKMYHRLGHPVRRWILHVLEQSPQVLSIYVKPDFGHVHVPDIAFTCSTLEEMRLHVDTSFPEVLEPLLVKLPGLRKLNLGYYTIKTDFMSKLLLGCPNLEELELYACRLFFSEFSCGSLKTLVVSSCCYSTNIRVSIPSLQYLKVTFMPSQTAWIVFENMASLVKACVCFLTDRFESSFHNNEARILKGLSGVTNLEVVLHGSEAEGMLKHVLKDCPDFEYLTSVYFENFDGCLLDCVDMIDRFLQHSAILEHLSFYLWKDGSDEINNLEQLSLISNNGIKHSKKLEVVECKQPQIYDCEDKLMDELTRYQMCFMTMEVEIAIEEVQEEDEDDDGDGGSDDGF